MVTEVSKKVICSNPNEERALKSEQTEQDFANRIAAGIASYFGG